MAPRTLAKSVEILKRKMEGLEGLPEQVASLDGRVVSLEEQISQFRTETRVEFSAVREEMREMRGELVARIVAVDGRVEETRTQMRVLHEEVIGQIAAVDGRVEDTRTQMRVLHEEVIGRISLLDEHWNGRGKRPGRLADGPARARWSKKGR